MFGSIKKVILKSFYIDKFIEYEDNIYKLLSVTPQYISVSTPYFSKRIYNKDINKVKFLRTRTDQYRVGETVSYYNQQYDQMKTGIIAKIYDDGIIRLEDSALIHTKHINIPFRRKRRYLNNEKFKQNDKQFIILSCFLNENGYCYICEYKNEREYFSQQQIMDLNKKS